MKPTLQFKIFVIFTKAPFLEMLLAIECSQAEHSDTFNAD